MRQILSIDKKYDFYERSVQNPEGEVSFIQQEYFRQYHKDPFLLREDFCGTGAISCHWVQQDSDCRAFGVDLDQEPINIGKERHYKFLNPSEKKRMTYVRGNVLSTKLPPMDVICAFNFSYFIFKERRTLKRYFQSVRKSLKKDGAFFIDLFGGPLSQTLVTDTKKMNGLTYYWECQHFNPLNHHCCFAIHFKDKSGKKYRNVFTYDWRFWTMPELKDLLHESGFKTVKSYWEGDDNKGGGNGEFAPAIEAENCEAWVSYLVAFPN